MASDPCHERGEFSGRISSDEGSQDSEETCVIYKKVFEINTDKVTLTEKGVNKINSVSNTLGENITAEVGDFVHSNCRLVYTNSIYVSSKLKSKDLPSTPRKRRHCSREGACSDTSAKCLFCENGEKLSHKGGSKRAQGRLIPVKTTQFQDSLFEHCSKRNDRWSREVKARVEYMRDLFARDAVYHHVCYSNFRTGLQIPKTFSDSEPFQKKSRAGRPENPECAQAFQYVIEYLDKTDIEQVTVPDLVQLMKTRLGSDKDQAYGSQHMKRRLKDHYGETIIITEKKGTADVVTLKETASAILRQFFKQPKSADPETQKVRLLKAAAKLVRNDIKLMDCNKDMYPEITLDDQASFLPSSLKMLLTDVFKGKEVNLKLAAIGQAIIQTTRPNTVLAPLQIELGVQMHKVFGLDF
ncbi:hypothetical protein V1264_003818 [Littorina saxatilis]|uniref:Uncharacterized protein n=1 Tax=Littorina saxatilis TaxID=31220 RepID=A0AAN9G646_9CAEN